MTDWARKRLDTLSEALTVYLSSGHSTEPYAYLLIDARKKAHRCSTVFQPNEGQLDLARASVCKVCREHRMYECDVPFGWSPNCAFLRENVK